MTEIYGINVNNQIPQEKTKKGSLGKVAGGVLAGGAVFNATKNVPLMAINPKIIGSMQDISQQLTKDQLEIVNKATNKLVETAGLTDKGVKVVKAKFTNMDKIHEILEKELGKTKLSKFLPKKIKDQLVAAQVNAVTTGGNAFYASASKNIVLPQNGLNLAAFHEAGHAMNANLSKIGAILQKARGASILALPILAIGLFKNKKEEGEQPKNFIDKSTDFIKKNAGKLTFASFLPTVIEEGLASIKGHKLASKLLSPDLVKKVDKSNLLGFATYAILAVGSGIGAHFAVKLRDKIVHGKQQKQQIQNNQEVQKK